jgi:hypothetical protein
LGFAIFAETLNAGSKSARRSKNVLDEVGVGLEVEEKILAPEIGVEVEKSTSLVSESALDTAWIDIGLRLDGRTIFALTFAWPASSS